MLRDVGGNAFPTFAFLDAEGQVLGKHQGGRSTEAFQATRQAVRDMLAAKEKVADGDQSAQAALLIAEIELGRLGLEEARDRYASLPEVTDQEEERIIGLLNGLEFAELRSQRRRLGNDKFQAAVLDMVENQRIPRGPNAWRFWYSGVMPAALQKKDAELAERALQILEKDPFFQGDNARYLERYRKAVEELGK